MDAFFGADGRLAGTLAGYEPRAEQKALAAEVADALELHALCLLLGYRGKFAFGNAGEIHSILARIRDKIARIRGPLTLASVAAAPPVKTAVIRDRWVTRLAIAAMLIALLTLIAFVEPMRSSV